MQRPDDAKRRAIMTAAVRMFGSRHFHEVRLDDVAAAARISKGTVYTYFKSKEDLYDTVVLEGLSGIVDTLRSLSEETRRSAWTTLSEMVEQLAEWAHTNPHVFKMMAQGASDRVRPRLARQRKALGKTFEAVLKRGVKSREIIDPMPVLTAQFIPACVRSAIRYGPGRLPPKRIARHILHLLSHQVRGKGTSI